jgi:hypothetical protein
MHDVERELIKATGYKAQRKFDNRQDYLGSILNAVLKLSNDDFDLISDDAAMWANAATEAKNAKSEELPDFDEIDYEGETDGTDDDDGDEVSDADDGPDDVVEVEAADPLDEEAEVESAPKAKKTTAKKAEKPVKTAKPKTPEPADEEDVILDKWGCMEGSKNSQALHMFEKGATAREVKLALGGTYYNILGRCVKQGHTLEKEGALIKLTHKSETKSKKK